MTDIFPRAIGFEIQCGFLIGVTVVCLGIGAVHAAELKFVTEPFPPFVTNVPGDSRAGGPLAEVVLATCERIKATCTMEIYPWRRALRMVERSEADGIFPMARNPERDKTYYFSEPFVQTASSFFVREGSKFKYTEPKDLDGYTVGVYGPSAGSALIEETLKAGSTGKMEVDVNNVTVLRKLAGGRYGVDDKGIANMNRDVGLALIQEEGITGVVLGSDLKKVLFHVGFWRKTSKEASIHEFNAALKVLIREGKVKAILDKYGIKSAS